MKLALRILAFAFALSCAGSSAYEPTSPSASSSELRTPAVQAWPEANARFRDGQSSWLGADSAYSVSLGDDRVLWLFGDTFIDPARDGSRANGPNVFLRNTAAVQHELDLSRATIEFFTGPDHDGTPTSFFSETPEGDWFWPLHGTLLSDGKLLLFRIRVAKVDTGFGFKVRGWDAIAIDAPNTPPSRWTPRVIARALDAQYLLGGSVFVRDDYLYAYAAKNDDADHTIFLARFPLTSLRGLADGALADPEWYTASGYQRQSAGATPSPILPEGQIEFSVHYEAKLERFMQIQTRALFASDPKTAVVYRTAPSPEGPWSEMIELYKPPPPAGADLTKIITYAAKAHPELRGGDLVLTYVQNDVAHLPPIDAVYYPEVVRLTF